MIIPKSFRSDLEMMPSSPRTSSSPRANAPSSRISRQYVFGVLASMLAACVLLSVVTRPNTTTAGAALADVEKLPNVPDPRMAQVVARWKEVQAKQDEDDEDDAEEEQEMQRGGDDDREDSETENNAVDAPSEKGQGGPRFVASNVRSVTEIKSRGDDDDDDDDATEGLTAKSMRARSKSQAHRPPPPSPRRTRKGKDEEKKGGEKGEEEGEGKEEVEEEEGDEEEEEEDADKRQRQARRSENKEKRRERQRMLNPDRAADEKVDEAMAALKEAYKGGFVKVAEDVDEAAAEAEVKRDFASVRGLEGQYKGKDRVVVLSKQAAEQELRASKRAKHEAEMSKAEQEEDGEDGEDEEEEGEEEEEVVDERHIRQKEEKKKEKQRKKSDQRKLKDKSASARHLKKSHREEEDEDEEDEEEQAGDKDRSLSTKRQQRRDSSGGSGGSGGGRKQQQRGQHEEGEDGRGQDEEEEGDSSSSSKRARQRQKEKEQALVEEATAEDRQKYSKKAIARSWGKGGGNKAKAAGKLGGGGGGAVEADADGRGLGRSSSASSSSMRSSTQRPGDLALEKDKADLEALTSLVEPFLDKARAPGVNPRKDVVPHMRQAKMSGAAIKLFKRLLRADGISLDGGRLPTEEETSEENEEDGSGSGGGQNKGRDEEEEEEGERQRHRKKKSKSSSKKSRKDDEKNKKKHRHSKHSHGEGEDEEEDEEDEELPQGLVSVVQKSEKYNAMGKLMHRKQKISASNFQAQAHTLNGRIPDTPICACVDTSKPPLKPLRWLHIPKCGTSLGISLIYYGCTDVPDQIEIRVAHAGIEPTVPEGVDSDFDYKRNCLKQNAFVARAGVVGSHVGLDYTQDWDLGASKGHVVGFFRSPNQRMISAYWHAQHADGMPRSTWGLMREKISLIERNISHWLEKIAEIPKSQMQRHIPREILPEYQKAMSIYFHWPGVQGCMTKMVLGFRCADDVELTQAMLKKAEYRIRHDFAFVGLTEEWDASICLFHQMLGGHAREIEFLNYRAGKMTRVKEKGVENAANGGGMVTATSAAEDKAAATAEEQRKKAEKLYDATVLRGMVDKRDTATYEVVKDVFVSNIRKFSTCPNHQDTQRYPIAHILSSGFLHSF